MFNETHLIKLDKFFYNIIDQIDHTICIEIHIYIYVYKTRLSNTHD